MSGQCEKEYCNHPRTDGSHWCMFHAPTEEKGVSKEKFNAQALHVFRDSGNCREFVFPWEIDLHGYDKSKHVDFQKAVFEAPAVFRGNKYQNGATFDEVHFKKGVSFRGTNKFFGKASFVGATFGPEQFGGFEELVQLVVIFSNVEFVDADFQKTRFAAESMAFEKCEFGGSSTDFDGASFCGGHLSFAASLFRAQRTNLSAGSAVRICVTGRVDFAYCEFRGKVLLFDNVRIDAGGKLYFNGCRFQCVRSFISECSFKAEAIEMTQMSAHGYIGFSDSTFHTDELDATGVVFDSEVVFDSISFVGYDRAEEARVASAESHEGNVRESGHPKHTFRECHFQADVSFRKCTFGAKMLFEGIALSEHARLRFSSPKWHAPETTHNTEPWSIVFRRVYFNEFDTIFEGIDRSVDEDGASIETQGAVVAFRECKLRNVWFLNCNMSMISFYNSADFEEALLRQSKWESDGGRQKVCCEDILLPQVRKSNHPARRDFGFPTEHAEIADIYIRLKAAADRARDYHLASWFYFNEFEMKRRSFLEQTRDDNKAEDGSGDQKRRPKPDWLNWSLYSAYKVTAGYGEKPQWSALWLALLTFGWAFVHLFNGFQNGDDPLNYDWGGTWPGFCQATEHFGLALAYALYRIVPANYLPMERAQLGLSGTGFLDLALPFLNTVTLVILIVFIGIGLKRHFRRF